MASCRMAAVRRPNRNVDGRGSTAAPCAPREKFPTHSAPTHPLTRAPPPAPLGSGVRGPQPGQPGEAGVVEAVLGQEPVELARVDGTAIGRRTGQLQGADGGDQVPFLGVFGAGAGEQAVEAGAQGGQRVGCGPGLAWGRQFVCAIWRIGLGRGGQGQRAVGFARVFVRAVLIGGRFGDLGRRRHEQAVALGLAVLEEGALGALRRHAGGGHVAQCGVQRAGVAGLLQVRAVGAAGAAGRDLGHGLDQGAVGADLVPHRDRDRGHQLLLGGVDRAVAGAQVADVLRPLGLVLLGQDAERPGAQAVLQRVHRGARLALGRVRAALLRGVRGRAASVMAGGPAGGRRRRG